MGRSGTVKQEGEGDTMRRMLQEGEESQRCCCLLMGWRVMCKILEWNDSRDDRTLRICTLSCFGTRAICL